MLDKKRKICKIEQYLINILLIMIIIGSINHKLLIDIINNINHDSLQREYSDYHAHIYIIPITE